MVETASKDNTKNEDKPKPCCVCKPEKEVRDQCLLFNGTEGKGSEKCTEFIEKYKQCMKGYGFEI
mgnify:CR=1 FL=1